MTPGVTILSTADIDSAVWTNKQYLAVGLAGKTKVSYIESMGLRAPTLSTSDMRRILGKIRTQRSGSKASRPIPSDLQVVSPKVLPFHGSGMCRRINLRLVRDHLLRRIDESCRDVLWTFSPLTYGLEKEFDRVVYHSVDLLHTLPGVPANLILESEERLCSISDYVLASSSGVAQHLQQYRGDVRLWQNVADVERFTRSGAAPREPQAVFAGNLTPTKIDFSLLQQVADLGFTLKLAGPVNIDGIAGHSFLDELLQRPNVEHLGNLNLDELSDLFNRSMVGLIPYRANEYTQGVFPLKVYEYMAAGMSVVSTPIASLVASAPPGVIITTFGDFSRDVERSIRSWSEGNAVKQSELAQGHSWTNRIEEAWGLLSENQGG